MTDYATRGRRAVQVLPGFALKDVSFVLPRGYIMGLIGPNGAGKTTIIKLIMNLVRRDSGRDQGVRPRQPSRTRSRSSPASGSSTTTRASGTTRALDVQRRALGVFYPRWSDEHFTRLAARVRTAAREEIQGAVAGHEDQVRPGHGPVPRRRPARDGRAHDAASTRCSAASSSSASPAFLQDEGKSILFSTHITSDLERIADFITFVRQGQVVFSSRPTKSLDTWAVVRGDERRSARPRPRHPAGRAPFGRTPSRRWSPTRPPRGARWGRPRSSRRRGSTM